MRNVTLNTYASVTLDASGNGQVSIGPTKTGEVWNLSNGAVSTNQGAANVVNDAQCSTYFGPVAQQGQLVSTTLTGSSGDSDPDIGAVGPIYPGQVITAVWIGGDSGAVATLSLFGTKTIPG